jgi:hypothetical protein
MEFDRPGKEVQLPSREPVAAAVPAAKFARRLTSIGCKPMPPFGLAVPVQFSKIFE